jgi:hypothetical protein
LQPFEFNSVVFKNAPFVINVSLRTMVYYDTREPFLVGENLFGVSNYTMKRCIHLWRKNSIIVAHVGKVIRGRVV